eukprot:4518071-Amphidinium_carterae.1
MTVIGSRRNKNGRERNHLGVDPTKTSPRGSARSPGRSQERKSSPKGTRNSSPRAGRKPSPKGNRERSGSR